MRWYTRIVEYIIQFDDQTGAIRLTDGGQNLYSSQVDVNSNHAILQYVNGTVLTHSIKPRVTISQTTALVEIAQVYQGLEIQAASIELEKSTHDPQIKEWLFELASQACETHVKAMHQAQVIEDQDRVIEEMTLAKEQHQRELLERVTVILNARVQHPEIRVKEEPDSPTHQPRPGPLQGDNHLPRNLPHSQGPTPSLANIDMEQVQVRDSHQQQHPEQDIGPAAGENDSETTTQEETTDQETDSQ